MNSKKLNVKNESINLEPGCGRGGVRQDYSRTQVVGSPHSSVAVGGSSCGGCGGNSNSFVARRATSVII